MDEYITLIHPGVTSESDIKNEIYAELKSTGRDEQFSANKEGYRKTMKFTIWATEYDDEPELEFNNKRLTIYRTYQPKGDKLELYAGERIGNVRD